jgi:abhydrolase domain-containing protein 12
LANFGRIDEFSEDGRKVVLVKTLAGGHDYLGLQEGLQDIIGRTFAIGL